ncbi:MAG: hypothetical protein JJD98_17915 [Polaromonas sp.]|nr:hypothetical protein [Polaromonas sp.]
MKATHTANFAAALAAAVLMAAAGLATAQTVPNKIKAVKPAAANVKSAEPAAKKKRAVSANRTNLKSTAKNVAAGIEAAEAAMNQAELAIAERVDVGNLPCELGASVTLARDAKTPGYFEMQGKNFKYRMFPVLTSTGAIRLEDQKAGAVWLQLANKSMLMNQKLGIRLADECMSPAQVAVAENLKLNPPPSLLDAPKPMAIPTAVVAMEPPAAAPSLPASAAR